MSLTEDRIGEGLAEPGFEKAQEALRAAAEGLGFALVRVKLFSGPHDATLQIMAEKSGAAGLDSGVGVDDLAKLSRALSAVLDVEDPIPDSYSLEVSTPGIDRPLTRLADFERFAGFEAKLETRQAISGRKRFSGRLLGLKEGNVLFRSEDSDEEVALPASALAKAKLKLTDELIAASSAARN
jgi:ribosome maturation factor RimP